MSELGFVIIFSVILVGLGVFGPALVGDDAYGAVAVGASGISLISILPMCVCFCFSVANTIDRIFFYRLIIDYVRPGSFSSWIAVELAWASTWPAFFVGLEPHDPMRS